VDGISHDLGDNPTRDERRDAWLAANGFRVLRIAAVDVVHDVDVVVRHIVEACRD